MLQGELTMSPKKIEKLEDKIIGYLNMQSWSCTTEDIAKNCKVSWQTAQIHLFKLVSEGKVKYRKVGRQNQWWLAGSYNKQFKKE